MSQLDGIAHVVQLALTPVFLLNGLATMLNVFTTRLGRVADRAQVAAGDPALAQRQRQRLRLRSRILDAPCCLPRLLAGSPAARR